MATKHTPGPWAVEEPSKGCNCHIVHGGDTYAEVAAIYSGEADQQANANLIAAAPELLAACEALLEWSTRVWEESHPVGDPPSLNAARTAIAKAKGEV